MNVAVLTSLYPGPPKPWEGVFAERRWSGMAARGHRVRVVQPLPRSPWPLRGRYAALRAMPAYEERLGVPIERPRYLHFPRAHRANAARFATVGSAAVLRGERPDVCVLDYAWPAARATEKLSGAGLAVVVNGRGSDVLQVAEDPTLREELVRGLRAADGWTAVSDDLVRAMDELAGAPGRGVLIPNGVDLERFGPASSRGEARTAIADAVPGGGPLVLVVGHLIARKDPLLALTGFERGAPPDARLVFVGRGPLEAELRAAVAARGLSARVHLLGERDPAELAALYRAADLLLLTSYREGRPNVVLEALASGLPVVATRAGGTAELLTGFEERLLVEERTAEAVGARVAGVLSDPPSPTELRALVEPLSWEASFRELERCLDAASAEDHAA